VRFVAVVEEEEEVPKGDMVCNKAHFVPNLQLPLTKYLHTADSEERSELWEKVQFAPAVQVPCLKNLQGT
jgi:hypothetical protein